AASPLVVAVRLGAGELVVRGRARGEDWVRKLRIGMPRPGEGNPAIAALYGRERVADLEARRFAGEHRDAEIERTGLDFQIATRLTPFVAIDERRKVHPAVRHQAVPQELPHGTTAAAFGLRPAVAQEASTDDVKMAIKAKFALDDFGESRRFDLGELEQEESELDDGGDFVDDVDELHLAIPRFRAEPSMFSETTDDDIDQIFADAPDEIFTADRVRAARVVEDELDTSDFAPSRPMLFYSDADEFPDEAFEESTKVRELDELIARTEERPEAPPMAALKQEVARPRVRLGQDKPTGEYPVMITSRAQPSEAAPPEIAPEAAPEELEQLLEPDTLTRTGRPSAVAGSFRAREQSSVHGRLSSALSSRAPEPSPARSGRFSRFWILAILAILAALAWWLVL
ncbi:MAG TPA: hypothetical protein VF469_16675, partial [Kofleriaceae bacterium]